MTNKPRPTQPCNGLHPHRWSRLRSLRDVVDLNTHLLETVAATFSLDPSASRELLAGEAQQLSTLDSSARRRAADIPLLLVDLNFNDTGWWRSAIHATEQSESPLDACRYRHEWQPTLTREALLVAWSAVREDRASASLLLGIPQSVATLIGALTPRQIDVLGAQCSADLRPRWSGSRVFWRRLIRAARAQDEDGLATVHLYALQLVGGELMRVQDAQGHPARPVRHASIHKPLSHPVS